MSEIEGFINAMLPIGAAFAALLSGKFNKLIKPPLQISWDSEQHLFVLTFLEL